MEMDLSKKIEARISELEKRSKELSDFINGATANMKKLLSEKSKANDESNAINGAIQAFKSVLGEISENEKNKDKDKDSGESLKKEKKEKNV